MFEKAFENVTIKTVTAEKRGYCLEATNALGERILMDFCGTNPALVPDGTNAYLFGNSLIVVTRWSDMSQDEKETVETGELCLVMHPCEHVQFSLRIGNGWSDVFTTLHHCYNELNDENAPVKEAIFLFADTHDSDYIISRSVILPPYVQKYLQKCNTGSHSSFSLDDKKAALRTMAAADPTKDFWDLLYDLNWDRTASSSKKAKSYEPDNVPNGVYVEIDADNTVSDMYLNDEEEPQAEAMSDEVQIYLKMAELGLDEGQYNLGVCYETGDGVAQDFKKAVYWYKKAADQGYAKAQLNLGICIYNGYGTDADPVEAAKLFLLAANQGNMYAQFNMGVACYNGDGVPQDIIRAVDWFQKAAKQGHPEAKKILGG